MPVQVSVLEALVGTDPQLIHEFLQEFGVSAARSAAGLAEACGKQRSKDAAEIAHKLKSSARSVGAVRLGELCAAIEVAGTANDLTALTELFPSFEQEMSAVDGYLRSLRTHHDSARRCA
jgi:HPt (histidine-containing phosphotransfer) domain-containing protein